jgi:CubicO group peptidase (beta-lactamase class C family)
MRRLLLTLVVLLTTSVAAQLPPGVDEYIEKSRQAWDVPGIAIAVVRDGKVVAAKGYGVRELGKPARVDADTLFDIASLSKSFTAAVAATLVDEGKMRWDDPVRKHLPSIEFPDPARTTGVTIRDLLSHRVGLETANTMLRYPNYDGAEALLRIRGLKEQQPFRTGMIYSNLMYGVAGEAVAAAGGASWQELVRTRLLAPLGMRSSTAGVAHETGSNYAKGHATIAGKQQPIRPMKHMVTLAAGGVNSTANDMTRWLLFQLGDGTWEGKRIISAEAMEEMHSPHNIIPTTAPFRKARMVKYFAGYGLGWQVMDYRGHPMMWHSGNADGIPSYMAILPEEKIGVFVTINTWNALTLHGSIAGYILDALLGYPARDNIAEAVEANRAALARAEEERQKLEASRATGTAPSRPLSAYAGVYRDPLHADLTVRVENDKLVMQFAKGQVADLEHWHYDTFRIAWRDPLFGEFYSTLATFGLDPSGQPRRLDFRSNRDDVAAIRTAP